MNQDILESTIFIAVTGFNEKYMAATITSAVSMAERPERLFFGVNYISSDGCFEDIMQVNKNVRVVHSVSGQPRGWGIDRCNADSFWNGEDFYLQIDGHMLFEKSWDSRLIRDWENIRQTVGAQKPIISNHCPQWWEGENGEIIGFEPGVIRCCPIYTQIVGKINKSWSEPVYLVDEGKEICDDEIREHHVICGHFMFASSEWLLEIGHDPRALFIGDQSMIALRSITRGYKVFSTGRPYMWHLSKRHGAANDWRSFLNSEYFIDHKINKFERDRVRQYLTGEKFDIYGAPDWDSLNRYQLMIGIDFKDVYRQVDELQ